MRWTFDMHRQIYRRSDGVVITMQAILEIEDDLLRGILVQALDEVCA